MLPCFARSPASRRSMKETSGRPSSAIACAALQRPAAPRDLLLRHADLHVGRHRDVHHLRVRQFQVVHQRDIVVDRLHLQARIVALLLADGGDGVALVVVRREDQRLVGQAQQLAEQRFVLRARVAVLEIGAAGAADQQRVAGEHAVAHQEAVGIVGVAGRVQHVDAEALDGELVAFGEPHRHHVGLGVLAHHRDAMGAVAQRAEAGDVVGVQMGVDRLDQLEVEFADQLQIAIDLLQHRVDDQRLAAARGWRAGRNRCRKRCRTAGGRSSEPRRGRPSHMRSFI